MQHHTFYSFFWHFYWKYFFTKKYFKIPLLGPPGHNDYHYKKCSWFKLLHIIIQHRFKQPFVHYYLSNYTTGAVIITEISKDII